NSKRTLKQQQLHFRPRLLVLYLTYSSYKLSSWQKPLFVPVLYLLYYSVLHIVDVSPSQNSKYHARDWQMWSSFPNHSILRSQLQIYVNIRLNKYSLVSYNARIFLVSVFLLQSLSQKGVLNRRSK